MESKITIKGGFDAITVPDGHFRKTNIEKGDEIQPHICSIEEIRSANHTSIHGTILRTTSIKKDEYDIWIELDSNRMLVFGEGHSKCSCQAGATAQCKHAAAIIQWVNTERCESKTDDTQQWKTPSKKQQELYPKGKKVQVLMGLKRTDVVNFKKTDEELKTIRNDLEEFGLEDSSLYKCLTVEKNIEPQIFDAEDLPMRLHSLFDTTVLVPSKPELKDDIAFYIDNVECDLERGKSIFSLTTKQSECPGWFAARKFRISASRAHKIWKARKTETRLKYFFESISDLKSLRYGREMEKAAIIKYEEVTRNRVYAAGLIIKIGQPWLGATPDGIAEDEHGHLYVLEIKCPSSCKNDDINLPYVKNEADFKLVKIKRDDAFL